MSKGVQIAIGAVIILAVTSWFGLSNMDQYQYFQTLSEFQQSDMLGKRSRVHGYVLPGSIDRNLEAKTVSFTIINDIPHLGGTAEDGSLDIVYNSLETPDLFQDAAEVVVEGTLQQEGSKSYFDATLVLAKCPSKFESKEAETASMK